MGKRVKTIRTTGHVFGPVRFDFVPTYYVSTDKELKPIRLSFHLRAGFPGAVVVFIVHDALVRVDLSAVWAVFGCYPGEMDGEI